MTPHLEATVVLAVSLACALALLATTAHAETSCRQVGSNTVCTSTDGTTQTCRRIGANTVCDTQPNSGQSTTQTCRRIGANLVCR